MLRASVRKCFATLANGNSLQPFVVVLDLDRTLVSCDFSIPPKVTTTRTSAAKRDQTEEEAWGSVLSLPKVADATRGDETSLPLRNARVSFPPLPSPFSSSLPIPVAQNQKQTFVRPHVETFLTQLLDFPNQQKNHDEGKQGKSSLPSLDPLPQVRLVLFTANTRAFADAVLDELLDPGCRFFCRTTGVFTTRGDTGEQKLLKITSADEEDGTADLRRHLRDVASNNPQKELDRFASPSPASPSPHCHQHELLGEVEFLPNVFLIDDNFFVPFFTAPLLSASQLRVQRDLRRSKRETKHEEGCNSKAPKFSERSFVDEDDEDESLSLFFTHNNVSAEAESSANKDDDYPAQNEKTEFPQESSLELVSCSFSEEADASGCRASSGNEHGDSRVSQCQQYCAHCCWKHPLNALMVQPWPSRHTQYNLRVRRAAAKRKLKVEEECEEEERQRRNDRFCSAAEDEDEDEDDESLFSPSSSLPLCRWSRAARSEETITAQAQQHPASSSSTDPSSPSEMVPPTLTALQHEEVLCDNALVGHVLPTLRDLYASYAAMLRHTHNDQGGKCGHLPASNAARMDEMIQLVQVHNSDSF